MIALQQASVVQARGPQCDDRRRHAGMRSIVLGVLGLLIAVGAESRAQASRSPIESWISAHQQQVIGELADLLAVPSVRGDAAWLQRTAVLLRTMLAKRGFAAEPLATNGPPLVVGELPVPGATRTLLLYAQYDGQAVNPSAWKQATPFTPTMRTGRVDAGATEIADFRTRSTFEPD